MSRRRTRRHFLKTGAVTGILGIAGCTGEGDDDSTPTSSGTTEESTPTDQPTPTAIDDPLEVPEDGWPMFRYDAANSGHSTVAAGAGGTLEKNWDVSLSSALIAEPIVYDDMMFLTAFGDEGGGVGAIPLPDDSESSDAAEFIWEHHSPGYAVATPPAIANDTLFLAVGSAQPEDPGIVLALDARTGDREWQFEVNDDDDYYTWPTAPAVHGSSIVVNSYSFQYSDDGESIAYSGSTTHALAANGETQWEYQHPEYSNVAPSNVAVANGLVYVTLAESAEGFDNWENGITYALDSQTGERQWEFTHEASESSAPGTPAVAGGQLFLSDQNGYVYSLDGQNGEKLWEFGTDKSLAGWLPPAATNEMVYASTADSTIFALDTQSGDHQWQYQPDYPDAVLNEVDFVRSAPVVANNTVYLGGRDGALYLIDAQSGEEIDQWQLSSDLFGWFINRSPVVVDDTVYVSADVYTNRPRGRLVSFTAAA